MLTGSTAFRSLAWFILLAAIFLALRLPVFIDSLNRYSREEAITGNLTQDLLTRTVLPAPCYQFAEFAHGPLVLGMLFIPFFKFMGGSFATIKVVGLLISLVMFLVWLLVIKTTFGRQAVLPFALVYLLCPQNFLIGGTLVFANHYESLLPTGLILLLFYRISASGSGRGGILALGLLCGLGAFFCFQGFIPALLVMLLSLSMLSGKIRRNRFFYGGLGFFLGFIPSILANLLTGGVYRTMLSGAYPIYASLWEKLYRFSVDILPNLPGLKNHWANLSIMSLILAAWLLLGIHLLGAWANRSQKDFARSYLQAAIFFFPALWICIYLITGWDILRAHVYDARYAIVLFPFFMAAIAALGQWRKILSYAAAIAFGAIVLFDGAFLDTMNKGIQTAQRKDFSQFAMQHRGSFYHEFLRWDLRTFLLREKSEPKVRDVLTRLSPQYQPFADELLGLWLSHNQADIDDPEALLALVPLFKSANLLKGFGEGLAIQIAKAQKPLAHLAPFIAQPDRLPDSFWIGLGSGLVDGSFQVDWRTKISLGAGQPNSLTDSGSLLSAIFAVLPDQKKNLAVVGMGGFRSPYNRYMPRQMYKLLSDLDIGLENMDDQYLMGYGAFIAYWTIITRNLVPDDYLFWRLTDLQTASGVPALKASFERGYYDKLAELGYHLEPIEGITWKRLKFAAPGY